MNWLVSAEVWLTNHTPDPISFALLTGLTISSWGMLLVSGELRKRVERSDAHRLLLGQLRTEGVAIRNEVLDPPGGYLTDSEWSDWEQRATEWARKSTAAVKGFSAADAEWFRTLDVVGPPRIPMPPQRGDDAIQAQRYPSYAMHDCHLARLDQLIQKYWKSDFSE